jgi:TonB-dependent starch-binding outer membrane protein SusC
MPKTVKLKQCWWAILLCLYSASAFAITTNPLQGKEISISVKNISLAQIIRQVSKKSGVTIFFQDADLSNYSSISFEAKDKEVQTILHELLDARGLAYEVVSETVIAIRKAVSSKPSALLNNALNDTTLTVSGRVLDEHDNPVIGATIVVKGTTNGATTNNGGVFVLKNVKPNSRLNISNIAYLTQEISVNGRATIGVVRLKNYVGVLDETQIIAYGETSRRRNISNTFTIKAADIEKQPVSNPLLALEGKVPGVFVTQSTGLPGTGVTVRIQGQNSFLNGNDPLYVIDGVPYTSQLLPTLNGILGSSGGVALNGIASGAGNPLSFINPNDIESIDILKDAAATAIYGSRAANGAILITTKKGKSGQTRVDVNAQSGWGHIARELDLLNISQYVAMRQEALKNDGITAPSSTDYDINGTWDKKRNIDWQKALIGNTAKYTDVQASISGGSENTTFLFGTNYHKETTVFPGDLNDQKGSFHFSLNNTSSDKRFKSQLSASYMTDINQIINYDLTGDAVRLAPNAPTLHNADGSLNWSPAADGTSTWLNPLAYLYNKYKNSTNNLIANAMLSYQIIPGLDVKSSFGFTDMQTKEISLGSLNAELPENRPYIVRTTLFGNSEVKTWIMEPQLSYRKNISRGVLDLLLGTTIQQNSSTRSDVQGSGFSSDLVADDLKSAANITVRSTIDNVYKYNAGFGRLNYNWDDKYIVELTLRRDGSSRFGANNRFHNFASVAGGWIFSNEHFIKDDIPFLSFGKVRGSYGTTGSDQIGEYQFMNLYLPIAAATPYQGAIGVESDRIPNPYLKWEETRKLQVGLDVGFWADRLFFTANYFHNRSGNQLMGYDLPITAGFSGITLNFPAVIQNTGLELSIKTDNIRSNDFQWTTNANITIPKNKLVSFPDKELTSYNNSLVIGKPVSITRVSHLAGVDPLTGLYQFRSAKGIIVSSPSDDDKNVFIDPTPKFYGGLQNSLSYKGIQLDFTFQFVKQIGPNYKLGYLPGMYYGTSNIGNQPVSILGRWKDTGNISSIQRYGTGFNTLFSWLDASNSDAAWSDASYIRLKNVSLSWQFPSVWCRKIHVQGLRAYVKAQNLLTFTAYKGLDPETKSSFTLPPLRIFTVGAQLML